MVDFWYGAFFGVVVGSVSVCSVFSIFAFTEERNGRGNDRRRRNCSSDRCRAVN